MGIFAGKCDRKRYVAYSEQNIFLNSEMKNLCKGIKEYGEI
jgi:hypothetical protein